MKKEITKKGIVKINPFTFKPIICYLNGRVLWGGTPREKPAYDNYQIINTQNDLALNNLNKTVKYRTVETKFGETYAQII